jgi:hypothetical protein
MGSREVGTGILPAVMDFDTFSARAQEIATALPTEFMAGVESVEVHRAVKRHPFLSEIVTLGECATSPLSDPTGQEPFKSVVHVYYGSFADLARRDPSFDVDAELRETIEHEVQHHLEDRAGVKDLLGEDDLFEAHARFRAGMEVPAGWYRFGEPVGDHVWAVDMDLFLELPLRRTEWDALRGTTVRLDVMGEPLEVDIPDDAEADEIFTLEDEGLFEPDEAAAEGEVAADETVPGSSGDLHIVPVVR